MALYKAVTDRRYSQIWQRVRSAMVCTSGKCLPEIAPQGHFLALRAQGATSACGLLAMTNLKACTLAENAWKPATAKGAHYPQGARRIRKAAKPPTAAQ